MSDALFSNYFEDLFSRLGSELELEIIFTLLRQIGIPPPTAPPGESLCIKTGNQIGGWVFSRFDHVIHAGPKYTISSPSGRGMSVDYKSVLD